MHMFNLISLSKIFRALHCLLIFDKMSITKISNFQSDASHSIHLHIPPALSEKSVEEFWRMYLSTCVDLSPTLYRLPS